jgi:peptidoglycan/LPS O-acetylase OafA/YrhL
LAEIAGRPAIAAIVAVVANVLLRALAVAVFDIPDEFEHLAVRAVIVSTLAGVVAAGLVYALIARRARNPDRTFAIVAIVALALSLLAPLSVGLEDPPEYPGTDARSIGTMMAMHVVAAAIAIATLTRRRVSRGARSPARPR